MFESQPQDSAQRPLKAVPISRLARDGRWSLDAPRSYLVPVLMWFTVGQGRIAIGDTVRGYTANNAIFLPANTQHACEALGRTQGTALFLGAREDLAVPSEVLHLRLSSLKPQAELNQLVEGFRQDAASTAPFANEILHHRAALISLWLAQQAALQGQRAFGAVQPAVREPAPSARPAKKDRSG